MIRRLILTLFVLLAPALPAGAGGVELVMVEEDGCIFCVRWKAEVGPEYPITPEGLVAPLRAVDMNAPLPEDLVLASRPRFTPTFILVNDGLELARIEGYPGEDFFWGLLARMLEDAGITLPN